MQILISGSGGFVGSRLKSRLAGEGHCIIEADVVNGVDITNWNHVKNLGKPSVIVHLAARIFVPHSFESPRDFYNANVNGTLNMLELAKATGARFIMASSYVYGEPDYLPIDEKHPLKAFNPYAGSKLIAEQLVMEYNRNFGVPVIILRPFNLYGPGQNRNFLIPSIIRQAAGGEILLNDPEPRRDFVFIDDMVDAYMKCIEKRELSFEVFNIGSGRSISVRETAEMIISLLGKKINVIYNGTKRKNEVMDTVADNTRAAEILQWHPVTDFYDGLKECLKVS